MSTGSSKERYKDKRTSEWRRRTTYTIWYMMIKRCYDPLHDAYFDYGGRGIEVHEDWLYSPLSQQPRTKAEAFSNFIRDIGLRPSQYLSLDRIDANLHYHPHNLRWATATTQNRNKRSTIMIPDPDPPHQLIPVAELAQRLGIRYQTLRYHLQKSQEWPGDIND